MYKSVTLLKHLVANASLGFVYFGYSVGYLNPALQTVDIVFGITENVDYFNGLLSAIMTIGAAIGVLIMPNMLQYFSRRQSLIILDFFGIFGYGIQLVGDWNFLVIGRFVAGVVKINIDLSIYTRPQFSIRSRLCQRVQSSRTSRSIGFYHDYVWQFWFVSFFHNRIMVLFCQQGFYFFKIMQLCYVKWYHNKRIL